VAGSPGGLLQIIGEAIKTIERIKEIYAYRELLFNITKKELKLRYRNSFLGFLWSLLNPLLMMLILSFVFSLIAKFGIKNFAIFLLVGLLPWNFFNMAVAGSAGSIISYGGLVKKVYFPRELLPLSLVLSELINFVLAMVVLFVALIFYGYNFWPFLPVLLFAVVIQTLMLTGLAFIMSSLNVYFRDIQQIISVALLALFYGTPIIYSHQMVAGSNFMKTHPTLMMIYNLNPMAALVDLYRSCLYDLKLPGWSTVLYALGFTIVVVVLGFYIFGKLEPAFAEEV
jgi:ABC-2 type transport system permease protein